MQIGTAKITNQLFAVAPTRQGFGIAGGQRVDGLIGFEVLSRFVTTFDYAGNTVIFQMPDAATVPAGATSSPSYWTDANRSFRAPSTRSPRSVRSIPVRVFPFRR